MAGKRVTASATEGLKDEVYRQMLRLEAGHPAALALALALLQAWIACDRQPSALTLRQWVRRVSPVCLPPIEAACRANSASCDTQDKRKIPAGGSSSGKGAVL